MIFQVWDGCHKKTKHTNFPEKQKFLTPLYAHVRRFFPTGETGGGVLPTSRKSAHSPHLETFPPPGNIPPSRLPSSIFYFIQVMLILILIDFQYLQKFVFSFEKGSNSQNHSSSASHHPIKKYTPQQNFQYPHTGWFYHPVGVLIRE